MIDRYVQLPDMFVAESNPVMRGVVLRVEFQHNLVLGKLGNIAPTILKF